jgi:hypothetical protein
MPLSSTWLGYDTTIQTLGKATKVTFPGPNGGNAIYGAGRQDIKNEKMFFNYVGLVGADATTYPGTYPELNAAASPMNQRNNPTGTTGGGPLRNAGTPRVLEMLNVPLVGPRYNGNYRSTDPLLQNAWRNTIGDAVNFYLAKDTANLGLKGLCPRRDKNYFDPAAYMDPTPVAPATTPDPNRNLPWTATTVYAVGNEASFGGEIYQAQTAGALPQPDPTPVTGNVGPGQPWTLSNGPFARASQFWQVSWAEVIASRFQVDSPKYKGKTAANGTEFKPGTLNLNTASKAALQCLAAPSGTLSAADAQRIVDNRKAPAAGATIAGGLRRGFVLASEAFGPVKNLTAPDFDTLAWLPQQCSCRSDVFAAYIVVQGYKQDDFNKGPVDVRRVVAFFTRNTSGSAAKIFGPYNVPNN